MALLLLIACTNEVASDIALVSEEADTFLQTPEPEPEATPTPEEEDEPTEESVVSSPEPEPIPTPESAHEPSANMFSFPFSFSTEDLHGDQVTAASLGEKEIFFVYFWTTWCSACVDSIPNLAELAEIYGDRVGFMSLLGDFATARDTAIRITEGAGVAFITVDATHDDFNPLMELLSSGFVPTSVIIGRDGNVIGDQIVGGGMERFQEAIEDALGR